MSNNQQKKAYRAEEKVAILKRHLLGKEDVSQICDELKLHPSTFYEWQKVFFENGAKAFQRDGAREANELQSKTQKLEEKLMRKDSVLAELMEEHIALKKSLGEL